MSSWAGFTDEELLRLRQTAGEDRTAPGSLRKSAINTAKRQRPREKVRSNGTSSGKLDSRKKEGNEDQGARDCAQLAPQNTSSRSNGGRSTSRLDSREEEKENSSPECQRRGKSVSQVKERNSLPKESSLETKSLKNANDQQGKAFEVDDGHQEQSGILTDKEVEIDLPNIIDENDR